MLLSDERVIREALGCICLCVSVDCRGRDVIRPRNGKIWCFSTTLRPSRERFQYGRRRPYVDVETKRAHGRNERILYWALFRVDGRGHTHIHIHITTIRPVVCQMQSADAHVDMACIT